MSDPTPAPNREVATLGAGCYWCIEAVLEQIDGVESVLSGFMGGTVENPSYYAVCSGSTGHAEVVQVTFDPFDPRQQLVSVSTVVTEHAVYNGTITSLSEQGPHRAVVGPLQ